MRIHLLSSTQNNDIDEINKIEPSLHDDASWGPWLFRLTMAGTLVFYVVVSDIWSWCFSASLKLKKLIVKTVEKMKTIKNWVFSFVIAIAVFYTMDHAIMSMQGLPLNVDMTPAQ